MQIREQGKKIQLIRTHYNKDKKRTEGKVFDSFEIYLSTIPENIRPQLSDEEVDQLESYLSERSKKSSVDSLRNSLSAVNYTLSKAAKALSVDEIREKFSDTYVDDVWTAFEQLDADKIYAAMAEMAKALKKAGYKKPAKDAPITASGNDENQGTLFDVDEEDTSTINTK